MPNIPAVFVEVRRAILLRRLGMPHLLAGMGMLVGMVGPVRAQDTYPSHSIVLQVGYAAGGTTDKIARLLAQAMKDTLGQAVVVENRPGAGGNVSAASVAIAKPDGYTLYFATISSHAIGPALYSNLGFDPITSFEPVALVARYPLLILSSQSFAAASGSDVLAYLKANPNKFFFGTAGVGSAGHLTGELLKSMTGISMSHVAYKGGGPAALATMSGEISLMIDPLPGLLGYVKSGQLKPVAVTSRQRSPLLPNVPTVAELGVAGFETSSWAGVVAPAKTPKAIVLKLQHAIEEALKSKPMATAMSSDGVESSFIPGDRFNDFIASEGQRWGEVVRSNHIQLE